MLEDRLYRAGCDVYRGKSDTDFMIAETAMSPAREEDAIAVADDTVFVLLIHYKTSNTQQHMVAVQV